jgi:hypothetical protein
VGKALSDTVLVSALDFCFLGGIVYVVARRWARLGGPRFRGFAKSNILPGKVEVMRRCRRRAEYRCDGTLAN